VIFPFRVFTLNLVFDGIHWFAYALQFGARGEVLGEFPTTLFHFTFIFQEKIIALIMLVRRKRIHY